MLLEHAEMDENVARGLLADYEAETSRGVEPFDDAGYLDQRLTVRARFCPFAGWRIRFCELFTPSNHSPHNP